MPLIPTNRFSNYIDSFIRRGQPGASDMIFPRFMEENAIFTYPAFPVGIQWREGSMRVESFMGAAGATNITDLAVPTTALRYYQAISASHDDATPRRVEILIRDTVSGANCAIRTQTAAVGGEAVAVTRPIVIGERHQVRAQVNALGGGNVLTLRIYSVQQGLGSDLPGL